MDWAFTFVEKNGITTEDNYAYKGSDGKCNTNAEANKAF